MLVVDMMDVLKERIKEEEHVEGMKEDHDENEDESEYDEHVWLSLINAHEVVRYLSNEVQKLAGWLWLLSAAGDICTFSA